MTREQMEKVWPGCSDCEPCCECCAHYDTHTCDVYDDMSCFEWYMTSENYCPMCGRPLTPAAWAELKKRLEEADDGKTLVKNLPPGARLEWKGMMWTVIDRDKRGIVILGDKEIPREEIQKLQKEADDGK